MSLREALIDRLSRNGIDYVRINITSDSMNGVPATSVIIDARRGVKIESHQWRFANSMLTTSLDKLHAADVVLESLMKERV